MNRHNGPYEKKLHYVGKALPNTEIKLIDKQGKTVPIGTQGEVCCRGYLVMPGYFNDE